MRLESPSWDFPQPWPTAGVLIGLASSIRSWPHGAARSMPMADSGLARPFDTRIGVTFGLDECGVIASHGLRGVDAATGGLQG